MIKSTYSLLCNNLKQINHNNYLTKNFISLLNLSNYNSLFFSTKKQKIVGSVNNQVQINQSSVKKQMNNKQVKIKKRKKQKRLIQQKDKVQKLNSLKSQKSQKQIPIETLNFHIQQKINLKPLSKGQTTINKKIRKRQYKKSKQQSKKIPSKNEEQIKIVVHKQRRTKSQFQQKKYVQKQQKKSFYKIITQTANIQNNFEQFFNFLQKDNNQKNKQLINYKLRSQVKSTKNIKYQKVKVKQQIKQQSSRLFQNSKYKSQIKTLSNVLKEVSNELDFPKVQQFENNFFYILDKNNQRQPIVAFGFRYYLFRFCKYQVYFSQHLQPQQLLALEIKIIRTIKYYCLENKQYQKSIKFTLQQRLQYMQHFLTNLLPFQKTKNFADIYLQVGIQYFNQLKNKINSKNKNLQEIKIPSVQILYMIQKNLLRLLFHDKTDIQDDQGDTEDYSVYRTFYSIYLDFYCMKQNQFQTFDKIQCVGVAKFLKIVHPQFIQFIKETIQTAQQNYSTVQFLLMLGYLVQSKNTPYQYFYKHKGTWMKIIQAAHDFSDKKTKCCIKFLQIFSRQRFIHCQKIYFSLLESIQNNVQAMQGKQLVRTLYYYSRARYGTNPRFVSHLVDKISRWLPYLQQKHFSLLVRSIGNLNYQSSQLIEKLKNINYERFLCELKFGCQNLGSYYKQILKEVQQQSKGKVALQGQQCVTQQSSILSSPTINDKII